MNICQHKSEEECKKLENDCIWSKGKLRSYCRISKNKSKKIKTKINIKKSKKQNKKILNKSNQKNNVPKKTTKIKIKKKSNKSEIKITSWNVNGIRSKSMDIKTKQNIFNLESNLGNLIKTYNPDILCFSETKIQNKDVSEISKLFPFKYQTWKCSEVKLGYSGVSILSKIPFKDLGSIPGLEEDIQGRNLFLEFDKFYLVNVYVPNSGTNEEYRKNKWDLEIEKFLNKYSNSAKPLIYCGDLNVVSDINDIYNPEIIKRANSPGVKEFERKNFKQLIDIGYTDSLRFISPEKKLWTWWDPRSKGREKDNGWRLDYFLVSNKNIIKDSRINNDIYGSDHCPISLNIEI